MLSFSDLSDRYAQLRQVVGRLAVKTLVCHPTELVRDPICHIEPVQLSVKELCQTAVVLASVTDVSVAAFPSTWRRTVFQSLQLPPGSVCVLLFVTSWRYRLTASARTVVRISQLPAQRRGTHCQHTFVLWTTAPLHLDDHLRLILFSEY